MNKKFTEEKIIKILKEQESGIRVEDLCRQYGVGQSTFYAWKAKYAGLEINEAKRLRELEAENGKLKRMLADAMLDNVALKDVISKKW